MPLTAVRPSDPALGDGALRRSLCPRQLHYPHRCGRSWISRTTAQEPPCGLQWVDRQRIHRRPCRFTIYVSPTRPSHLSLMRRRADDTAARIRPLSEGRVLDRRRRVSTHRCFTGNRHGLDRTLRSGLPHRLARHRPHPDVNHLHPIRFSRWSPHSQVLISCEPGHRARPAVLPPADSATHHGPDRAVVRIARTSSLHPSSTQCRRMPPPLLPAHGPPTRTGRPHPIGQLTEPLDIFRSADAFKNGPPQSSSPARTDSPRPPQSAHGIPLHTQPGA